MKAYLTTGIAQTLYVPPTTQPRAAGHCAAVMVSSPAVISSSLKLVAAHPVARVYMTDTPWRGQTSRADARFSTYSGAPSLQPSLAPTFDSASHRSSARASQQTYLHPKSMAEKGAPYGSANPAAMASTSTLASTDPKAQDLKSWSGTLERMQDERLERQRFTMTSTKSEEVSKLALGAKVERALSRRMVGQDATFTPKKPLNEKRVEVEAN
jgi:hypothetical protein